MRANNLVLFLIPALIWGSTWLVIKFQLGVVDPMMSVGYRFLLAGLILLAYCRLRGYSLNFNLSQHFWIAFQGFLLFSTNYWLVYEAELYLTSGLVAVGFSILIFFNLFFSAIFLQQRVSWMVLIGAIMGLAGTAVIFKPELEIFSFSDDSFKGLVFCLLGVLFASLGNVVSARNQKKDLPVIQTNAFGMFYGAIYMILLGVFTGKQFVFDTSMAYITSIIYLTLFGSIFAFGSYLTLIGKIGAGKAAYVILTIPVVAIWLSVMFEGYDLTVYSIVGIFMIIGGNVLALRKK